MGGDEESSNACTPSQRHPTRFPVGSSVEIRTNDKGYEKVFFSATVIWPPPHSRKSSQVYVEYHDLLVSEGKTDRLREFVGIQFVRPTPPLEQNLRGFEPNDIVDAWYNDGWWNGIVSRFAEAVNKVVILFDDPPDELTFPVHELRYRWDWVDEMWVRPQNMAGLMFEVGGMVEVSFDGRDLQEAWFPALIQQDLGNGVFSVEYSSKEGSTTKAVVNSGHIRPLPPVLTIKEFVLQQKVDVFYEYGWWSGVIKEHLKEDIYIVCFKQMNLDKVVTHLDLRPHLDLKDGNWLLLSPNNMEHENCSTPDGKTSSVSKRKQRLSDSQSCSKVRSKRSMRSIMKTVPKGKSTNIDRMVVESEKEFATEIDPKINHMVEVEKEAENEPFKKPLVVEVEKECATETDHMVEVEKEGENESIKKPCMADDENQRDDGVVLDVNEGLVLPSEPLSWPFERNSVWKTIESMDVFKRMPQKPHFKPLENHNESLREGLALGFMAAFASLVDKSWRLKLDDEKSIVNECETLDLLEEHGFDVSVVRDRITKFVAFKDSEEKLGDEVKKLNINITERTAENSKIEKEIEEINEDIRKLQEQLLLAESEKAKGDKEIAALQARLNEAEEEIKNARSDFLGTDFF